MTLALIDAAITCRRDLVASGDTTAVRLFNGFVEGLPALVIDLYGTTALFHDYSPGGDEALVRDALAVVRRAYPQVKSALWKVRQASEEAQRNGVLLLGENSDLTRRVREYGVRYAVELDLNRDASLYLDTRDLRHWAQQSLAGQRVLNTFAYTGSLGVAARAAGASVVQTDLNRRFLNVAKDSYALNGWPVRRSDFRTGDFFDVVGQLKREQALFDCVFVDPPFFSVTRAGRVDLEADVRRLVNKVRPLVADEGRLVLVDNALFLPGAALMQTLESLCADGHLSIERLVPVAEDAAGYPQTRRGEPPADPAPFNHSTKIAVLKVKRRDGRR